MSAGEDLTLRSATELAAAIRRGETSSRDIVEAHVALLERVNPRINAVIFERLEDARAEAEEADARVAGADDPDSLPPLLGVPFTIKESICVEGMPNAAGCVGAWRAAGRRKPLPRRSAFSTQARSCSD